MKRVSSLVENFLLEKSSTFNKVPIEPKQSKISLPIKPINKWLIIDKSKLYNKYMFQDNEKRDLFLVTLLGYEKNVGHRAKILFEDCSVEIEVFTKDLDLITELDREYAKKCDLIYKNVCYDAR